MPTTNIFPSFTPAVHTNGDLANKTNFDAVDVPQNNFIAAIDDLRDLGVVTASPTVLVQNRDIMVAVDASGGAKTVTLPAATGQRFPITIKKVDSSTNAVTINRAGADTIEDPSNPLLAPTATSLTLTQSDQVIILYPYGTTQWRIVSHYAPLRYGFQVYRTVDLNVTAGSTEKVTYAAEDYDYGGVWDTVNSEFTAPVQGLYYFSVVLDVRGVSSGATGLYLYKNNSQLIKLGDMPSDDSTYFVSHTGSVMIPLAKDDVIDLRIRAFDTNRVVENASSAKFIGYFLNPFFS